VTSDAVGAPVAALIAAVAPIAPDPPVPEVSTPVNATTVIEATVLCERLAVTVTLLNLAVAKARQISAFPGCAFARFTGAQLSPPPVTPVTVMPPVDAESEATKASSNSFAAVVENGTVVMLVLDAVPSPEGKASMAN